VSWALKPFDLPIPPVPLTIKDGRVRADPQRQRRDGYQCEARAAAEQAHSVAHILPQRFKIYDAVHLIFFKTNLRAKGSRKT
jgi:hypothetical protein